MREHSQSALIKSTINVNVCANLKFCHDSDLSAFAVSWVAPWISLFQILFTNSQHAEIFLPS